MNEKRIRQFKLTTGAEILTEVVEWDDDECSDIVVRNIYEVETWENVPNKIRYYSLKPYMSFQGEEGLFQTINTYHITVSALPTQTMIDHYISMRASEEDAEQLPSISRDDMTKKRMDDRVEALKLLVEDTLSNGDSDEFDNILSFPSRDKFH
mgnify:CR=1 FL=1